MMPTGIARDQPPDRPERCAFVACREWTRAVVTGFPGPAGTTSHVVLEVDLATELGKPLAERAGQVLGPPVDGRAHRIRVLGGEVHRPLAGLRDPPGIDRHGPEPTEEFILLHVHQRRLGIGWHAVGTEHHRDGDVVVGEWVIDPFEAGVGEHDDDRAIRFGQLAEDPPLVADRHCLSEAARGDRSGDPIAPAGPPRPEVFGRFGLGGIALEEPHSYLFDPLRSRVSSARDTAMRRR